ncbi:uncharacterized protein Bfra_000729 [Botrytis fragariae]|uniref:Uncharacterized protein n=1 Tax=Botrytis fragariae TaxID=1964551 RepID=A0A8H6B3X9_9HELO|nr:uncharacterized protein Bfra_000729 [Botrytis fragariae]KAF5878562.1 hypothetical protein Bfra_000729 [Botrytis fragariae]
MIRIFKLVWGFGDLYCWTALSPLPPQHMNLSHRIALFAAYHSFARARANNTAVSHGVLKGQLPIDRWHQGHWLKIAAEAALVAIERGFNHYSH